MFKIFLAALFTLMNVWKIHASTNLLGLTLGPMETFTVTDGTVHHMEMDQAIPGNILYADDNCLRTTNGSTSTFVFGNCTSPSDADGGSTVWSGFISGFTQLNTTHIVYLDKSHQCLQILTRKTGQSSRLVGDCGREGLRDGIDALFSFPYSVRKAKHRWNNLIIVDWHNSAIREVDLRTLTTTTLLKTGLYMPQDATYAADRASMVITSLHYLSKFTLADKTLVNLTYMGYGHNDGDLKQSGFIYPYEIITLSWRYMLVAQFIEFAEKSRLRLIDLQAEQVASICTGVDGTLDGDIFSCQLSMPFSLLHNSNTIYVGQKKAIRKIRVLQPSLPTIN